MKHASTVPATTRGGIHLLSGSNLNAWQREISDAMPPAVGQYWQGQGGIYAGEHEYPEGRCHVVFAAADLSGIAYGAPNETSGVSSLMDGQANTHRLIRLPDSHPAAEAAQNFQADGHADFYLPSLEELERAHGLIFDSFKLTRYLSSTECSAFEAFGLDFALGWRAMVHKKSEITVRPMRRFIKQGGAIKHWRLRECATYMSAIKP